MAETSVSAGYAEAVIEVAVAHGADAAEVAAIAGFDRAAITGPDDRVPFSIFKALIRAGATATGDPAFALHFGAESRFNDISIVGLIAHAAATMGEAFDQMNRFARLAVEVDGHDAGDRFAIVHAGGESFIEDRRRNPNDFPELTESTFARFIWNTRRAFPHAPFARYACFTHAEPAHSTEHARILGVPVHFSADRNALAIDPSWLSLRLPNPNRYVFGVFIDRAEALMADMQANKSWRGRVETALLARLHIGNLRMADVAASLGLSKASLYRRLADEGCGFDEVLDALRHRMAVHYLSGGKLSANEVAYLVGFADPATFSRAFKRWTGSTPGSWPGR